MAPPIPPLSHSPPASPLRLLSTALVLNPPSPTPCKNWDALKSVARRTWSCRTAGMSGGVYGGGRACVGMCFTSLSWGGLLGFWLGPLWVSVCQSLLLLACHSIWGLLRLTAQASWPAPSSGSCIPAPKDCNTLSVRELLVDCAL